MRTVCLNLDWDAALFWHDAESQSKVDERALPLSEGLEDRLTEFYRWFSELYLLADEPGSPLDKRLFDDRGIVLWEELAEELRGEYRVIYYSLEFADYFETVDEFEGARSARVR